MHLIHEIIYIDPGSGSLVFQAVLSSVLTGVVFFKKIVASVKYRFSRREKSPENEADK